MIEVLETPCPYCNQPVKTRWAANGMLSDPEVVLVADWVFHTECWQKIEEEYPIND